MGLENPILESSLLVPVHQLPFKSIEAFKATVKDKDTGEDVNIDFFEYDNVAECYKFARGDLNLIKEHFGHLNIQDQRAMVPMGCSNISTPQGMGLQFTGTLKDNQVPFVIEALKHDFGQYKAPPRFGKTVVMAYMTCKRAQKTLFLSHQVDLSHQALDTFYKFTNLIDLEYKLGKQIAGIAEKWEDLDKFDVAFLPYQKFVHSVEEINKYRNNFGVVYIDEVHKAATDWYSRVVSSSNAKVRQGYTGTIERKDKLHVINEFTIGPVMAEGEAEMIPCEVYAIETGLKLPFNISNMKIFWSKMQSFLSNNSTRNQIILSYLESYAKAGHGIIAVTDRTIQCDELARRLNAMGIKAESFHSKRFKNNTHRENLLKKFRNKEIQVLIAMRSMVLGLDIPWITAFFNLMPSANPPNYYQEFNRVRTPYEGKETAYIVDFVDDHHIIKGCWKNRRKQYIKNKFRIHNDLEEPNNNVNNSTSF